MRVNMRNTFIASASVWAIAVVATAYVQRQQPVATRISTNVLLSVVGLVLWIWTQRRQPNDLTLRLAWFGVVTSVIIVSSLVVRDWVSIVTVIWYVWAIRDSIVDTADGEHVRAGTAKAPELGGTVEYDSMHFSGVLIEEYSSNWARRICQAKTDDDGRFKLPQTKEDPTHCIKVSWPGTRAVYLRVQISPDAKPLLIRLKPKKPKRAGNWGE